MEVLLVGDGVRLPDADFDVRMSIHRDLVGKAPDSKMQSMLDYHPVVMEVVRAAERVLARRSTLNRVAAAVRPNQYPEWTAMAAGHYDGEAIIGDDLAITI